MHCVSKLMRVGGSIAMVIPPIILKEMKLLPNEVMLITYDEKHMDICDFKDKIKHIDKINKR